MHPTLLTSRQNPLVKHIKTLHTASGRSEARQFLIEGGQSVLAAHAAHWPLKILLTTEPGPQWDAVATECGASHIEVTPEVMDVLCTSKSAPTVVAVAALPPECNAMPTAGRVLIINGVSDPGNLGTLLRAADAAGATAVIVTAGSADPWSPKAVRSSAGSLFSLPPVSLKDSSPETLVTALKEAGLPILTAQAHGGQNCYTAPWPTSGALVIGHETRGISSPFQEAATLALTIPISGHAESLNAAMAGTLLLYAWRQSLL